MKIIVTQVLNSSANQFLPQFKHDSYSVAEYAGQMITADPGYEIGAVYIVAECPEAVQGPTETGAIS